MQTRETVFLPSVTEEALARADVRLEGPFPRVRADAVLLTQILRNLLSNAVTFVAPGSAPA
jgi:signal transduction histidine kinase